jgi:hypothetical protein
MGINAIHLLNKTQNIGQISDILPHILRVNLQPRQMGDPVYIGLIQCHNAPL